MCVYIYTHMHTKTARCCAHTVCGRGTCIYIYINIYIYMFIYIYICIYVHTNTHKHMTCTLLCTQILSYTLALTADYIYICI